MGAGLGGGARVWDVSVGRGRVWDVRWLVGVGVVVVVVVVVLFLRGGGGGSLLLVKSGDLYVVGAGSDVGRGDRVVEDLVGVRPVLTSGEGGGLVWANSAVAAGGVLVVAESGDGFGVWVVGDDGVVDVLVSEGEVGGVVVEDMVFLREVREGSERCYRGPVGDVERVFRGDVCFFGGSGHLLGADRSDGDVVAVRVESPEGMELLRGRFEVVPELSSDGRFLVVADDGGVSVVSVESGGVVWEVEGAVGVEHVSGGSGALVVGAQTSDGQLVVAVVGEGGVREVFETESDAVFAEWGPSGGLFLVETTPEGSSVLYGWDGTSDQVEELAVHDGALLLVGVDDGYGVVVNRDDFGVRVRRFSSGGDEEDIYDFDDDSGLGFARVRDGVLYLVGAEKAAVLPLAGGEPTESDQWDQVSSRGIHDGMLIAAGLDGTTETLFSLSPEGTVVEYGEYDQVRDVAVHDGILYATVSDGEDTDTYAFDTQTGDTVDTVDYRDYYLISNRQSPQRNSIQLNRDPTLITTTPEPEPTTAPATTTTTLLPPTTTTPTTTPTPETLATTAPTTTTLLPPTGSSGTRIAYTSNRDGDNEIYIHNLNTDRVEQVTDNTHNDWSPDWSPDGTRIAYNSDRDGDDDAEIYIYDLNTGEDEQITHNTHNGRFPAWSPDGTRIAYHSDRDGDLEIYIYDLNTRENEQITHNGWNDQTPDWSPDGTRIAYTSNRDGDDAEIYIHNLNTDRVEQVTDNTLSDWGPAWSPDGTRIAYTSYRDGNPEIYIYDLNTREDERITHNTLSDWGPAWSPDGTRIAYTSDRDGANEIYIYDLDTGEEEQITHNGWNDRSPDWS